MNSNLKNKVIAVIGGGRGIGKAIAAECAAQGAKVAVSARSKDEVEATAREIHGLGLTCDVRSSEQIESFYAQTTKTLGPIDGMVYCAGVYGPIGSFETNDLQDWIDCIEINLNGAARAVHPLIKPMIARKSGRIVLMSGAGQGPLPNFTAYSTSKGGIWRLTESLAKELEPHGIYLNAVAPGGVNTKFLDELLASGEENAGREMYQKALKQKEEGGVPPEKAARLTAYLLSDRSKGLWGRTLSALWDEYEKFSNLGEMCKTDIYQYRRVTHLDGKTR